MGTYFWGELDFSFEGLGELHSFFLSVCFGSITQLTVPLPGAARNCGDPNCMGVSGKAQQRLGIMSLYMA